MIDNAISPALIDAINRDWPADDHPGWRKEEGKYTHKWSQPASSGAAARLYAALCRPNFCQRIAALIGEKEVQPDNTQFGGGLHAIPSAGFLRMHTDFRHHPDGRRRVANLLLYVNKHWQPEWGGALRLQGDTRAEYLPIGGRAVIFRTDRNGVHGHPDPMPCPPEVMRRSIDVYYYTAERGVPDTTRYIK